MIDIATETIITLEDAAKRLLVSKTSVYGWVTRGFKGVRLEAFRVGVAGEPVWKPCNGSRTRRPLALTRPR